MSAQYQYERAESLAQKECLEDQKNMKKGSYESEFDAYITDRMKVHCEKHFGGDAILGNVEMKFPEEILSGNYGFLECLKDRPAIYRKYKTIWDLSLIHI